MNVFYAGAEHIITFSFKDVMYIQFYRSLQSRESHLLASSCEFLSDVVFHDFPAEIFLQRPNIIRVCIVGFDRNEIVKLFHMEKKLYFMIKLCCLIHRIC